jgi:hypothetical protein
MSNKRNIEPISIWSASGSKNATILALNSFSDYRFDDGGGKVTYSLIGIINDKEQRLYGGIVDVPSEVVQQWGASDEIIFQYVATQLGLTII